MPHRPVCRRLSTVSRTSTRSAPHAAGTLVVPTRVGKFPSNGPSNTMHGWATQQDRPFDIITDTRPKGIRRRAVTQDQLRKFLLLKIASLDERPRLLDAAVWYFRATDLDARFGAEPTEEQLAAAFVDDIALTSDDVDALFVTEEPGAQGAD